MFREGNEIVFNPQAHVDYLNENYPKPAIKFIPDWYKKMPQFSNGDKKLKFPIDSGMPNSTLKKCVPFLDAMTSGYMAYLDEDVFVEQVNNEPFIRWRSSDEIITWHTPDQYEGVHIPDTHHTMVAKWANHWTITLPKNYNILFSHPSNRLDLPFFTLSGLVSLNTYPIPVQFPFILKKGFEGIIEAGTPVCQLNIIKNESWKSKVLKFDPEKTYKNKKAFLRTFVGSYKKNYWTRHSYE
jgi:hypothetical protein